jgi:hypothetical protein
MAEVSLALSLSGNSFKFPFALGDWSRMARRAAPPYARSRTQEPLPARMRRPPPARPTPPPLRAAASRVLVPLASSWASSRTHTIVEGRAAGGEARPRSTGQQEAHLAKAGFCVQLVDMQLEATGRAASPRSQGGEVKSSAVLLRTLASASAFAPSKLCDPAEHI